MMKMRKRALIDVFTGWMNTRARDIADSMGNRSADAYSISLVQQTLARFDGLKGLKGFFELAVGGFAMSHASSGTTGRPFKPFQLHREPR